jgi:hypothetical protein
MSPGMQSVAEGRIVTKTALSHSGGPVDQLTSEISPESLATLLPDLPRWLEARSMLLSGRGLVLGLRPGHPTTFVGGRLKCLLHQHLRPPYLGLEYTKAS